MLQDFRDAAQGIAQQRFLAARVAQDEGLALGPWREHGQNGGVATEVRQEFVQIDLKFKAQSPHDLDAGVHVQRVSGDVQRSDQIIAPESAFGAGDVFPNGFCGFDGWRGHVRLSVVNSRCGVSRIRSSIF